MSWLLAVLIVAPLAGALLLAGWPRHSAERVAVPVGIAVSGFTLVVAVVAAALGWGRDGMQLEARSAWIPSLDVYWHVGVDGISLPLVLLTALLTLLCMVSLTWQHGSEGARAVVSRSPEGTDGRSPDKSDGTAGGRRRALVATLLLLETGMLGTFCALDLLLFFVFFELVLIPMWFVIADWGDEHDPAGRRRAATVFLLMTVIGSALMLVGFLVVYAYTGTFDVTELAGRAGLGMTPGVQLVAALAIGAGLAVKAPMWPLHIWLPDAHGKAPTVGSVLLAGVLLKMGTYGLVRVWLPVVPDGVRAVAPFLAGLAAVGIVYGSLACLAQHEIKRLVAYSSVGHMGFVLLGIATLTPAGVNGAMVANVAHGLITGLLFFIAGALKDRHGSGEFAVIGRGLYRRSPRLAAILAVTAFASLGLPGLAGFWGEMLTLLAAFDPAAGLPRATYLVCMVAAGVGIVITAAYFLRMVRALCQGEPTAPPSRLVEAGTGDLVVWTPLLALTLLFGLAPWLLLDVFDPAVRLLLGAGG